MPMRLSLVMYPLLAVALGLSRGGTVAKFANAKALSPKSARKPASLEIRDTDAVRAAVRRGLLIGTGDGRYYVNEPRLRRRQRFMMIATIAGGVALLGLTIMVALSGDP